MSTQLATLTDTSVDSDTNTTEQLSNLTFIEQKQIDVHVNTVSDSQLNQKFTSKNSYKVPSPTMTVPSEFSLTSKTITSSIMIIDKISLSSPNETKRNLLSFNQTNSFHLKAHSSDESIFTVDQLIQTSPHEGFILHKTNLFSPTISSRTIEKSPSSNQSIPNPTISLSKMISEIPINPPSSTILQKKSNHQTDFPSDISPQPKSRHTIQPIFDSPWKTKLSLKTLLSMANRDDAQAKKNPKPIDYHMFLTNKLKTNSIVQYQDYIDTKFQANSRQTIIEQDYTENRKLYKRVLDTMVLRKRVDTSIKNIPKSYKKKRHSKKHVFLSNESIPESTKPFLLTYRAIPISFKNKT